MNFDFRAYLDAKYPLDSRSLNRDVLENLKQALFAKEQLRCLDLGTGTGAMPKRLIELGLDASLEIMGFDIDADMIDIATDRLTLYLNGRGFRTESSGRRISAHRNQQGIAIAFECASVLDRNPDQNCGNFDLISAHQFMDLVPLEPAVEKIRNLLAPGGFFYSTLNYDGETALIPVYSDEEYERKILDNYDLSMEKRKIHGSPTGGAHSGRRLLGALTSAGFAIHSYGSSDWNITPVNRAYRDRDAFCLKSLLTLIHDEASANDAFDPETLATWHSNRSAAIDAGLLGMIVHQLDILAVKSTNPRRTGYSSRSRRLLGSAVSCISF
ncbi:MAG: class I SAM-dependent methyltransferase [Methylococcales bacterium]